MYVYVCRECVYMLGVTKKYSCVHTRTLAHTSSLTHLLTHTHTRTHTHIYTHTHSHTLAHTRTHSLIHSFTQIRLSDLGVGQNGTVSKALLIREHALCALKTVCVSVCVCVDVS
jgi:hypothetical protein